MTELTGLTVWGETVKKVKTVITKKNAFFICICEKLVVLLQRHLRMT